MLMPAVPSSSLLLRLLAVTDLAAGTAFLLLCTDSGARVAIVRSTNTGDANPVPHAGNRAGRCLSGVVAVDLHRPGPLCSGLHPLPLAGLCPPAVFAHSNPIHWGCPPDTNPRCWVRAEIQGTPGGAGCQRSADAFGEFRQGPAFPQVGRVRRPPRWRSAQGSGGPARRHPRSGSGSGIPPRWPRWPCPSAASRSEIAWLDQWHFRHRAAHNAMAIDRASRRSGIDRIPLHTVAIQRALRILRGRRGAGGAPHTLGLRLSRPIFPVRTASSPRGLRCVPFPLPPP